GTIVTLRGGAPAGLVPGIAPTLGLAAELGPRSSRFRGTAGALWVPEARTEDGQFAFGLTAGSLGACVLVARLPLAGRASNRPVFTGLETCAAAYAGAVHAVPFAFTPS